MLYLGSAEERRVLRTRMRLRERAFGKPRLSVFRSGKYIYAQVIDDQKRCTIVSATSIEKDVRTKLKSTSNKEAAALVGQHVAKRALEAGVTHVVFDRGKYMFHGRIKALAESAREHGLSF